MLQMIMDGIFAIVQGLVGVLLSPIDGAIAAALPDLNSVIDMVISALQSQGPAYTVMRSWVPVPDDILLLYFALMAFGLTMLAVNAIPGIFKLIRYIKFW